MLVLDTSAYMNGRRDHYPPETFPSVWQLLEEAMSDGRIIAPREVYRELTAKDDDLAGWAKERAAVFSDPSEDVQRAAGVIYGMFPGAGRRDSADPFVVAEAQVRGFTVVTYEGAHVQRRPDNALAPDDAGHLPSRRRPVRDPAGGADDVRRAVLSLPVRLMRSRAQVAWPQRLLA